MKYFALIICLLIIACGPPPPANGQDGSQQQDNEDEFCRNYSHEEVAQKDFPGDEYDTFLDACASYCHTMQTFACPSYHSPWDGNFCPDQCIEHMQYMINTDCERGVDCAQADLYSRDCLASTCGDEQCSAFITEACEQHYD